MKAAVGRILSSGQDGVVKIIDPTGSVCVRVVVAFGEKKHDSSTRSAGRSKT